MSYPKQVYFGDGGEINAHFLPADAAPDVGEPGDDMTIRYLATPSTNSADRFDASLEDHGPHRALAGRPVQPR